MVEKFRVLCPECERRINTTAEVKVECPDCEHRFSVEEGLMAHYATSKIIRTLAREGPQLQKHFDGIPDGVRRVVEKIKVPQNYANVVYLPGDERRAVQLLMAENPGLVDEDAQMLRARLGDYRYDLLKEQIVWTT